MSRLIIVLNIGLACDGTSVVTGRPKRSPTHKNEP
jgi:hypothetical protein